MRKKTILDYFKVKNDDQSGCTECETNKIRSGYTNGDINVNKKLCLNEKTEIEIKQDTNVLKYDNNNNAQDKQLDISMDTSLLVSDTNRSFFTNETSSKKDYERFEFMIDVRDKNGIRRGEPNYDPSTLYISENAFNRLTPFEKQFWEIKKEHFDTVIMFKKGAFYELYEEDAELTSKLFDFKVSGRVNMKMTGFPEKSFDLWARRLLEAGYKIGRVEQTENMIGKKMREEMKTEKGKEKIIKRELKEIVTRGTIYKEEYIGDGDSVYVGVIKECSTGEYVVMLYEASVNKILHKRVGGDELRGGVFAEYDVVELIAEKRIGRMCGMTTITPVREAVASRRKYELGVDEYECYTWLYNYMKGLCREECVEKADINKAVEGSESEKMVLDGATIVNLDILRNNYDENERHSLFEKVNYCSSAFGMRLLRKWIVSPLRSVTNIEERRRHVELFKNAEREMLVEKLRIIGDIERMLGKVFNISPTVADLVKFLCAVEKMVDFLVNLKEFLENEKYGKNCCDSMGINMEDTQMEKNLESKSIGLESTSIGKFNESNHDFVMKFSRKTGGVAEELKNLLKNFYKMHKIQGDVVLPGEHDEEYAFINAEHRAIEESLKKFLEDLRVSTGCQELQFRNINKEIFQIEAPVHQKLPVDFFVVSSTKTLRRFYSSKLKSIVNKFQQSEERLFQAKTVVFHKAIVFIEHQRLLLSKAISFVASVDCFLSFAIFNSSTSTTQPVFCNSSFDSLELRNFRSPIFPNYIANTFSPHNKITLVSGPNMGGKSTFLRSICLNIILAQIGLNVFCDHMQIPIFDRIFTRIGASDSLARGESTFMQEISETSRILYHSTSRSFVIIDELGRGTSTQDGNAIARAVLDYLVSISCYTLFSTHYHGLISHYPTVDKIYLDSVVEKEDILFLYKAKHGICPDSHALYVAKLAGIPNSIVKRANEIKQELLQNYKDQI